MEEDKWAFKRRMGMWGREESQTEVAKCVYSVDPEALMRGVFLWESRGGES